ncbi:hypothetical protein HGB07_06010 [Candidatus Roizmanbacteria bacterium]|nr:hypothetical protein [Candidatus Roizmanbacteria bacterium]
MEQKLLKKFLLNSNGAGYAGGEEKKWIKEPDGSTTIPYESGEWKSHDNFFGGEPYGGRMVVFFQNKPVWMMVYYGWVEEGVEADAVYRILREALKRMPAEAPYRGPARYEADGYIYLNTWEGDLTRYSGEEQIFEGEKLIYKAYYRGGIVDKRAGV